MTLTHYRKYIVQRFTRRVLLSLLHKPHCWYLRVKYWTEDDVPFVWCPPGAAQPPTGRELDQFTSQDGLHIAMLGIPRPTTQHVLTDGFIRVSAR